MTSFVLVPGAGGSAWYWHRVVPLLRAAGHDAAAVDLPGDDETAGLPDYARLTAAAIAGRQDVVLVAQSLGGFTAPLAAALAPVRGLVLVNAMIPVPGETPGAWWDNTGWERARLAAARRGGYATEFDLATYFLHDVPPEVAAAGGALSAARGGRRIRVGMRLHHVAARPGPCRGRLRRPVLPGGFPAEARRRPARHRADLLPGGHLIALSQPAALADYLLGVTA